LLGGGLLSKRGRSRRGEEQKGKCRGKPLGSRHSEGSIAKDCLAVGLGLCQNPACFFIFSKK
jgi:hypothetical protein